MSTATKAARSDVLRLPRGANARQAYRLAVAGATGALLGLYLYVELTAPFDTLRQSDALWWVRNLLAGVALGGMIGFFLNAADAWRDGALLRLARAGSWGAMAGAIGGAVGLVVGELALGVVLKVFGGQGGGPIGRAVSWAILGLAIGASQGLAERSKAKLRFGLIGGGLGGFLGGLLFEIFRVRLGDRPDLSQGFGIVILGAGLGFFLAFVEQILRRAWVVVANGRQEGRSYLIGGGTSTLGLDERATVGLFGDGSVARRHAEIVLEPDGRFLLHGREGAGKTRVNGTIVGVAGHPLEDGDRIELGRTQLIFRRR